MLELTKSVSALLLSAVGVHVFLGGTRGQLRGVQMMAVRNVRVVRCLFVFASLVVFGRLLVMVSRALVVFGGFAVKFCSAHRHRLLLSDRSYALGPAFAQPLRVGERL